LALMTSNIEDLFVYLATGADALIPLLVLLFFKKCKNQKSLWVIFTYCILSIVINYFIDIFYNNHFKYFFYALYTVVEFFSFSYILRLEIKNPFFRKILLGSALFFLLFITVYYSLEKYRNIDSVPIGIETILILVGCFYYLYEQMNDTKNLFIYSKYQFWLISGIMIYLSGCFFIYIFGSQLDNEFLVKYWFLTNIFFIIKNIFFCIAILLHVRHQRNPVVRRIQTYLN
jgi:hypothetical protein